jgi:hypothetical protein
MRPDLPRELTQAVDECLLPRPAQRPTLEELGGTLEASLEVLPEGLPGQPRPLLGRLVALGAAATVGLWLAAGHGFGLP